MYLDALDRDLMDVTRKTLGYVEEASVKLLAVMPFDPMACELWQAQFRHYKPLIRRVIEQKDRRVFQGEQVPATQKIVSTSRNIPTSSSKGSRDLQYGHKLSSL